jgi:multidrug transporter EmrE-like cation transporter
MQRCAPPLFNAFPNAFVWNADLSRQISNFQSLYISSTLRLMAQLLSFTKLISSLVFQRLELGLANPLLIGLGLAFLFLVLYFVYNAVVWPLITPLRKIPGPPPNSFWTGHFAEILRSTEAEGPLSAQLRWAKEYGRDGLVYFKFHFMQDRVLLTSIDAIKHVTSNTKIYHKPRFLRKMAQINYLGEGLLFSEDDVHTKQRRLIQPFFNHRQVTYSPLHRI